MKIYRGLFLLPLLLLQLFAEMPHPDSLTFKPLDWQIPIGLEYRDTLENGSPFYYAQDTTIPQFSLKISFRTGTLYEAGTPIVHSLSLRNGGSYKLKADEIDSLLDFYALKFSVKAGKTMTTVSMSGLSKFYPQAEEILKNVLLKPAFNEKRVKQNKNLLLQKVSHRFDNAEPVLGAAWAKVMYPYNEMSRLITEKEVKKVSVRSMQSMLRKYHTYMMDSAEVYVAFAGDIPKEKVKNTIQKIFPSDREVNNRNTVDLSSEYKPQVLLIHKPINQAYVALGQPALMRPDTNYYPLMLFNQILGGGGFNSRLMTKVRSNKGLTYSIYSQVESNYVMKGSFSTIFFTVSNRVNEALFLTLDVIKETLNERQDESEVQMIKDRLISALPSYFRTKKDIVYTYLNNEFDHRADNHFHKYKERLQKITIDDIEKAKKEIIIPDNFSIVIVGDTSTLLNATPYKERTIADLNPKILSLDSLLVYQNKKPEDK